MDDHWSARGLLLYTRLYSIENLVLCDQLSGKQNLELGWILLCQKSLQCSDLLVHMSGSHDFDWCDCQLIDHHFLVSSVNRFLFISPLYWSSSTSCAYEGAVLVGHGRINIYVGVCHITTVLWFERLNLLFTCLTAFFLAKPPVHSRMIYLCVVLLVQWGH